MATTQLLGGQALLAEVLSRSYQDNVDPAAAWAVAQTEGGTQVATGHYDPDQQGNPGWSYGPWQMRSPGALPIASSGPQGPGYTFAWSKQGVDYAIDQMSKVAAGETGTTAITSIVTGFEHPADPATEIARAQKYYAQYTKGQTQNPTGPGGSMQPGGPGSTNPGGLIGGAANLWDGISGIGSTISAVFDFIFSYRFLEIVGGGALVLVGLVGLMREAGVSLPAPAPVAKTANAIGG